MQKVSVILPTYNAEKTLKHTLDSIQDQEGAGALFDLELLVVDDCSTDATIDMLKDRKIPYVSTGKNTGGPNAGRNIGLRNATGDVICFIDHDDVWAPQKTRLQLAAIRHAPIVTTGFSTVDTTSLRRTSRLNHGPDLIAYPRNATFRNKLERNRTGQITQLSTIMIRRTLRHVLFEEEYGRLDFDWCLRLFEDQPSVEVPDLLVTRLVHGGNLSLHRTYREADYAFSRRTVARYRDRYPSAVRRSERRIHGSLARYYYLQGEMQDARRYFKMAPWGLKVVVYFLTSFYGHNWVKKQFTVFG